MLEPKSTARGRHHVVVVLAVTFTTLTTIAAGAAYAGYRYDRARVLRLLPGVVVGGIDVGGMTRAEAERALQPQIREALDRPITISARGRSWHRTAGQLGMSVEIGSAMDDAFASSDRYAWPSRVAHRLLNRPVAARIGLPVSYDRGPAISLAKRIAAALAVSPRDATLDVVNGRVRAVSDHVGRMVPIRAATQAVFAAVRHGSAEAVLRVQTIPPAVTEESLGLTIVVRVSRNRLDLYDGISLEKSYPVATGQPQYPTPLGHFRIITKEVDPTWVNPARDTWGKDEPAEIGPGPGNPLGTRAMALSAPAILIHGTYDDASIGHHASHGCIRMHIPDSVEVFGNVQVGTPVIIVD
jgi:lipoprotein-anchoring transpeptidase ErfK/SrfK